MSAPELTAMPFSAEDCRAKAFQCAELAATTRDPFSKLLLEQTAEQWNVLAIGAEQYELAKSGVPLMRQMIPKLRSSEPLP
jgi:hypothetical protein